MGHCVYVTQIEWVGSDQSFSRGHDDRQVVQPVSASTPEEKGLSGVWTMEGSLPGQGSQLTQGTKQSWNKPQPGPWGSGKWATFLSHATQRLRQVGSVSHWLKLSPAVRGTRGKENVNFIDKPASSTSRDREVGAHVPSKAISVKHRCHPPHWVTSRLKDGQVDERTTWGSLFQWRT